MGYGFCGKSGLWIMGDGGLWVNIDGMGVMEYGL